MGGNVSPGSDTCIQTCIRHSGAVSDCGQTRGSLKKIVGSAQLLIPIKKIVYTTTDGKVYRRL